MTQKFVSKNNLNKLDNKMFRDILLVDFPLLFKGNSSTESLVSPIYCRSGWNGLIYGISESLNDILFDLNKIYPHAKIKVNHIKEKFGRLSYFANINGFPKNIKDMVIYFIREKSEESKRTCETCGNEGQFRDDLRWIKTLCNEHHYDEHRKQEG